jgi:hypothetical protein
MDLHGHLAQAQFGCDLLVVFSGRYPRDHVFLTWH